MTRVMAAIAVMSGLAASALAENKKLTDDQRIELMRGLTAEYATVKAALPRSKKALEFDPSGAWDKEKWAAAGRELGPAARIGDLVQVTKIEVEKDAVTLEINGGMKKKKSSFLDNVQVGVGGVSRPVGQGNATNAPSGTSIVVKFKDSIGELTSAELKKMMAPVLDFDKHSATEQYFETLPPEIKQAILDKKPIEGMDRDQVLTAMGPPNRKIRENKEGNEVEDWIYGEPPGRVMFVTFSGPKVIRVKETYAGLGGTVAKPSGPAQ